MVDLTQINLSQFSGYDIDVARSGFPLAEAIEYQNLPSGGFKLINGSKFILNERYTVTPLPKQIAQDPTSTYPISQYPHTLTLTSISDSVQDGNGNWMQGAVTVSERACRAEPSSSGRYLVGSDGDKIYYDFVIYMPLPAGTIGAGTKAEITNQDLEFLAKGTIKRFNRGQLNARAWL
ncbi:MAG: hypothetical protein J0H07_10255 [Sphingobacteriales bacterium]|nr:hypothetical protein [Sphingobacteriales bacterium]